MSILSLAPPPSPTARLLWHLQRALHQAACHAPACVMSQHCLRGLMMIALEGLCFTASYLGLLSAPSQLPQRSTVSQDMALSRALAPGDVHPASMFFHPSPSKSSWVPPRPPGPTASHRAPCGSHGSHPGPPGSHFSRTGSHTPFRF